MRALAFASLLVPSAWSQALKGKQPLEIQGDPAEQMVEGLTRYLIGQTPQSIARLMMEREHRDGVGVDEWVACEYAKLP